MTTVGEYAHERWDEIRPILKEKYKLSEGELPVYEQIALGLGYSQIAKRLHIEKTTVIFHMGGIKKKIQDSGCTIPSASVTTLLLLALPV